MLESITLEPTILAQPPALEAAEACPEADPLDVIHFLLTRIEDQQAHLTEAEGFAELQNQEIDQLRARVQALETECAQARADHEVLMENALAAERELEAFRLKAQERPTIQLPFQTEQRLARLGYRPEGIRQAV